MTRRTLDRARTGRELCQHFDHHPALRAKRQSGSHVIYTGPNGQVIVPNHNGDVKTGTLRSIVRMAKLAGLATLLVVGIAFQLGLL